ncbi:prolyl oligopeptidase family serine peptidase [Actinoplanes sp. NPDC049265]|uniref:prolyl oligopeptidase family serine peptidase n=1 Tax=Actinoplanes sp. NPDC049265 TaxID=3363902 RepID=UPI0037143FC9
MAVSRRSVLAVGAGAVAGLAMPAAAHAAGRKLRFKLNAEVLDGGEQVVAVTLAASDLGPIDRSSLTTGTFTVHAKATSPLAPGDNVSGQYDLDRTVTAVEVDNAGDIVLELSYAEGQAGGATLGWAGARGRNVRYVLTYTITQNAPFRLRDGRSVTIAEFVQGRLVNPEVDSFSYRTSGSGMKYRLYSPVRHSGRRPLIVWLHGGGEGGSLPAYYDNETQLRANRGALGFVTPEAQRIFGGAYVLAPQSPSFWLEDGDRYAPQIRQIIKQVVRTHQIDTDRIHVVGASNGGYMSLKMTTVYPDLFASSVPICGVIQEITDAQLAAVDTPTWLVASRDDTTVPPQANTVHAHDLIPDSIMSLYDTVTWNGHRFPGHWSWIYVARNDPADNGRHVWPWMANQHL